MTKLKEAAKKTNFMIPERDTSVTKPNLRGQTAATASKSKTTVGSKVKPRVNTGFNRALPTTTSTSKVKIPLRTKPVTKPAAKPASKVGSVEVPTYCFVYYWPLCGKYAGSGFNLKKRFLRYRYSHDKDTTLSPSSSHDGLIFLMRMPLFSNPWHWHGAASCWYSPKIKLADRIDQFPF